MTLLEQVNNMNLDDLRMLNKLAVSRINDLTASFRFNFKKGDLVTIDGQGRGNMDGVVEKVMRKNVQVKVMNKDGLIRGIYNCTPTLLTHRSK
tara:strand:- start:1013 stop:1291 length:279 start_codon:yes stop_codon:yes gene_type:complete